MQYWAQHLGGTLLQNNGACFPTSGLRIPLFICMLMVHQPQSAITSIYNSHPLHPNTCMVSSFPIPAFSSNPTEFKNSPSFQFSLHTHRAACQIVYATGRGFLNLLPSNPTNAALKLPELTMYLVLWRNTTNAARFQIWLITFPWEAKVHVIHVNRICQGQKQNPLWAVSSIICNQRKQKHFFVPASIFNKL